MIQKTHMAMNLSGLWLMSEERVRKTIAHVSGVVGSKEWSGRLMCGSVKSLPIIGHHTTNDAVHKLIMGEPEDTPDVDSGYCVTNGVAIISVVGVLTKYPMPEAWMDEWCGFVPSETLRASLDKAMADWTVASVVFHIDSPGGMVAGTNELCDAIAAYRASRPDKPIYAVVSDLAASGGYYIASQCQKITCNPMGETGCIGVYGVLVDDSKFWNEMGVKFTLVSSGGVKGLGADGVVSQELIDDQKRGIMAMYDKFVADVARGRGMSADQARQLADGRCWIAREALKLGLIDEVASVDAAMTAITQETSRMNAEAFNAYAAEHPEAVAVYVEQGKKAGHADGTRAERERIVGILGAHGLSDHAAVASITAGHDIETAKLIADTASKAVAAVQAQAQKDAEASAARLAEANKKLEQVQFEAGGAAPVAGAKPAAPVDASADPKATAKSEWDAMTDTAKADWTSEKAYIAFRVTELKGLVSRKAIKETK